MAIFKSLRAFLVTMHRIVVTGKLKDKDIMQLSHQYLDRMRGVDIIEVKDETVPSRCSDAQAVAIKDKEWERIKQHCKGKVVALDEHGTPMTSEGLAEFIDEWQDITFVIGGALGLSKKCLDEVETLSLSPMTFPHQIACLLLCEQLYRAKMILKGHPYHKV